MSIINNALKVAGAVTVVAGTVYLTRKYYAAHKERSEEYRAKQLQVGYALKLLLDRHRVTLGKVSPSVTDRKKWVAIEKALSKDLSRTSLETLEAMVEWAKAYTSKYNSL